MARTDWEDYQAELQLPFDYVYFSKMEVRAKDRLWHDVQDSLNATCSDRNIIANI